MTPTTTTFYTVREAADWLKVNQVTVLRRIAKGELLAIRTNGDKGRYRISQEALEKYLAQK